MASWRNTFVSFDEELLHSLEENLTIVDDAIEDCETIYANILKYNNKDNVLELMEQDKIAVELLKQYADETKYHDYQTRITELDKQKRGIVAQDNGNGAPNVNPSQIFRAGSLWLILEE